MIRKEVNTVRVLVTGTEGYSGYLLGYDKNLLKTGQVDECLFWRESK